MGKKEKIENIYKKIGIVESVLEGDMPTITMPIYSYEADKEREKEIKKNLIKALIIQGIAFFIGNYWNCNRFSFLFKPIYC